MKIGIKGICNDRPRLIVSLGVFLVLSSGLVRAQTVERDGLARITPGRTAAENALWRENPLSAQFKSSKRVVVADLKGPGMVTMIHFALPWKRILNRDLRLLMYWDGESSPSVDVPFVDFFCDPAGSRDQVNTAFVNKRNGWNAYFPMPFRRSARIELVYDGLLEPGEDLWMAMPCYSYVCYRTLETFPRDMGYFHASWQQEILKLGSGDYVALEAKGKGKFVGWNVTVRRPGFDSYPVDENEKFYIDGETNASVEFQGLEDSFGFSWGFPESNSTFPLTGYSKFFKGAAAYRFFNQDAISFEKSLRVAIGFGEKDNPSFRLLYSQPGTAVQFSSTVYWYQYEPHAPIPGLPPAAERAPAPEEPFWPDQETLPSVQELKSRNVKLEMLCGRPGKEVILADKDYDAVAKKGRAIFEWGLPVPSARVDSKEVQIEVTVPKNAAGLMRIYVIDPDKYWGGRSEKLFIAADEPQSIDHFQTGRWIERRFSPAETADGKVLIRAVNARERSNAVISIIEWVGN